MNQTDKYKPTIDRDVLWRKLPVEHNPKMLRCEPIITKEEFILCYNEWIKKESEDDK
jgi:hypothetical protein